MIFDISNFKLKHIVSIQPELIENKTFILNIDDDVYSFKVERAASKIIELFHFFKYHEINSSSGSIEKKLKGFTYGKSFNNLSQNEIYNIRSSNFYLSVEGDKHEFEITGVGPIAVKVSLFLKYDEIESLKNKSVLRIKQELLDVYTPLLEKNQSYQNKLIKINEDYEKQIAKDNAIQNEIEKEEAEKERKRKELEEMLNRNKPSNNQRPFKMY